MRKSALLSLVGLVLISCNYPKENQVKKKKVKNVILMIGDGMGPGQISLLHHFYKTKLAKGAFAFDRLAAAAPIGISANEPYGNIVVDSACSATQLAIGALSRSEMIGLDKNGDPAKTILELAKEKGIATGLVSDTRMTHATPASFAAHVANRWSEDEIAKQMIETGPDLLFSGGANRFVPKSFSGSLGSLGSFKSRRADELDLVKAAKDKGYQVLTDTESLNKMDPKKKALGLFAQHNYPSSLWFHHNKKTTIPSLLEMSKAAINKLSQDENGFFLMIEGGQIDWAGHENDAGAMLHEMLSFNQTLNWVIDWVEKSPDTLLVVTADHETGGFGLGYNVAELPEATTLPGKAFKGKEFRPGFNYGTNKSLELLYQQKEKFVDLWKRFAKLEKNAQTPEKLKAMVEEATGMSYSIESAKKVMQDEPNPYQASWHALMKHDEIAKIDHGRAYYFDPDNIRSALIADGVRARQNVVWGTGGHTATGVHVYSKGPSHFTSWFGGRLTHPKLGELLQKALGLSNE